MRALRTLAAAAALALPAAAERPINPPAPEFPNEAAWINASGLTMRRLSGRKAALLAFVNLSSPNSVRLLPVLKAWFERYALPHLMVIAVITPDLDFQKDPVLIKRAVERFGIEYPVILDPDRRLWRAYQPEGWPALFLVDPRGRIVFDRLGEGGYREVEREIRAVLSELVDVSALPPPTNPAEPRTRECGPATPEISLGARRGSRSPKNLANDHSRLGRAVVASREGEVAVRGQWEPQPDGLRLTEPNDEHDKFLRVVYRAAQLLAVLGPGENKKPARVYVKQDDLWLHSGNAGKSVSFDADGRSYVVVDEPRLYDLIRESAVQPRELSLIPDRAGTTVHALNFSDTCAVTALP